MIFKKDCHVCEGKGFMNFSDSIIYQESEKECYHCDGKKTEYTFMFYASIVFLVITTVSLLVSCLVVFRKQLSILFENFAIWIADIYMSLPYFMQIFSIIFILLSFLSIIAFLFVRLFEGHGYY